MFCVIMLDFFRLNAKLYFNSDKNDGLELISGPGSTTTLRRLPQSSIAAGPSTLCIQTSTSMLRWRYICWKRLRRRTCKADSSGPIAGKEHGALATTESRAPAEGAPEAAVTTAPAEPEAESGRPPGANNGRRAADETASGPPTLAAQTAVVCMPAVIVTEDRQESMGMDGGGGIGHGYQGQFHGGFGRGGRGSSRGGRY
jgi:hypothetical protein